MDKRTAVMARPLCNYNKLILTPHFTEQITTEGLTMPEEEALINILECLINVRKSGQETF